MQIVLVAAVAENGVIGDGTAMPWRLKSDLKRFRARTVGKPVIMGRKTYQTLGRPLPGRTNIVVSRDAAFAAAGILVAGTIAQALEAARGDALRRGAGEIVVGGGSHIYAALMPLADRIDMTLVHAKPPGDTLFPAVDPTIWEEAERTPAPLGADDSAPTTWVTYRRREA